MPGVISGDNPGSSSATPSTTVFVARGQCDRDRASDRIAPRVGDERKKGLADPRRVRLDGEVGEFELQMKPGGAQVMNHQLGHLLDLPGKADRLDAQIQMSAVGERHGPEVLDQPGQTVHL